MKTKLFVIIVTPRKQDVPQVVSNYVLEGRPILCGGSHLLDNARFFKSYNLAHSFYIERVQPFIDTRNFDFYIRPCSVSLNW